MEKFNRRPFRIREVPFLRSVGLLSLALALLLGAAGPVLGQGATNAALRGNVSSDGRPLPGVAIEIKSPILQGTKTAISTAAGDFSFSALPPGSYTVTFKIQGFDTVTKTVALSTAQIASVDAVMALAGVSAAATVVGSAEIVSHTSQASTTVTSEMTNALPVSRSVVGSVALASGISQTGPSGNITISGANSSENVFTVDGAVIQDNIRATPLNLFVEDAIQETTTSVTGISAEFGRFTGGIVNAVTKSGGNAFSGSLRTTFTNDAWSARSPANEVRTQQLNERYEATFGGYLWKDKAWFFLSGRSEKTSTTAQTGFTNISFTQGQDEKRYQGKLTLTPIQNQSLTVNYLKVDTKQENYMYPAPSSVMDLDSAIPRQLPQDIFTLNYNGVLTPNLFVEALYSSRHFSFENSGSRNTDLIKGTIIRDLSRGNARYNSPTFCAVCGPAEKRDNDDFLVKGTYFLSTENLGSHNVVVGYDHYAGSRKANNYQSGSSYRFFGTSAIFQNGDIFPVADSKSYFYYTPINVLSQGSDMLTHSVFVNDAWRLSNRLSFNLGVRWDKNHAKDSNGVVTADDSAFSPRLAVAFDPKGDGALKVAASYAKYIGGIQEGVADSTSPAGRYSEFDWFYAGPPINVNPAAGAALVSRADALNQLFTWFFAQGCPDVTTCKLPLKFAFVTGLSTQIRDTLKSPYANEYVLGVNGTVAGRLGYRVDFVRRVYGDFYNNTTNMQTGLVSDVTGKKYDLGILGNSNNYDRNYTALQTQLSYRYEKLFVGASWTWSHTLGNIDGETVTGGPGAAQLQDYYPEYKQERWNNPYGALATDQRHRVRLYGSYDVATFANKAGLVGVSLVQSYETGTPYGALGKVASKNFVTNPGYAVPPSSVNYYFTARDAFYTDDVKRTDIGLNLSYRIANTVELFLQPQVLNLFNNQAVVAVDQTVRTAVSPGAGNTFVGFNPFTDTPVQRPNGDVTVKNANWDYAPTFGKPVNSASYQQPRTFFVSVGARF